VKRFFSLFRRKRKESPIESMRALLDPPITWDDVCTRFLFEIESPLAHARKLVGETLPPETLELRSLFFAEAGRNREESLKGETWYSLEEEREEGEEGGGEEEFGYANFLRGAAQPVPRASSLSFFDRLTIQLQTLEFVYGIYDLAFSPHVPSHPKRRRLDTFGESVVHVNQLYHRAFGVKQRKVRADEG
jgi:hypothetical protein